MIALTTTEKYYYNAMLDARQVARKMMRERDELFDGQEYWHNEYTRVMKSLNDTLNLWGSCQEKNDALCTRIKELEFNDKMSGLASMLDNIELNELRDEVEHLKQQRNMALRNWGLLVGTKNLLDADFLSQEEKNVLLEMQNEY